MSINTPNIPGTFEAQPTLEVDAMALGSKSAAIANSMAHLQPVKSLMSTGIESIPIRTINMEITSLRMSLEKIMFEINNFLSIGSVRSDLSPAMQHAHHQVCAEARQMSFGAVADAGQNQYPTPDHISYYEYVFAQRHQSRACRALLTEYESFVCRSAVGYNFYIKNLFEMIMFELLEIDNFMQSIIGGEYDDEVEQSLCKEIYYWVKSYSEYTKQFARETLSLPGKVPESEMGSINEVQAAQFKAFFSIKVNSYNSEIKKVLGLMKRELVDSCEMYYRNFLGPAVKSRSLVAYPLEMSLLSTNMKKNAPVLSGEIVSAASSINGNLASLLADFKQRQMNTENRMVAVLTLIREERKYVNYVKQMETKCGSVGSHVFVDAEDDSFDQIFNSAVYDTERKETINSSHKYLNDLMEDHHPQYMLKTGGVFNGDVSFAEGVKVAGIDLANHTHSGLDGSLAIRAGSIDYRQDRENNATFFLEGTENQATISVDGFSPRIQLAGQPLVDAIVTVALDGNNLENNRYSVNLSYVEVE